MIRRYPILQIMFLDEDLIKSAQYLTNKSLVRSISGCMQALIATRFYFIGIRNKKYYDYYFDKIRKDEIMDKFFPLWPLHQRPMFMQYLSKESKWTRKCKEHYDYVKKYFDVLLDEYMYRFGKEHGLNKLSIWLDIDAPQLTIPSAKLSKIILPWKVINIKYRRRDILDSYRLQFMNSLDVKPEVAFLKTKRDIPDFVLKYFKLDICFGENLV